MGNLTFQGSQISPIIRFNPFLNSRGKIPRNVVTPVGIPFLLKKVYPIKVQEPS